MAIPIKAQCTARHTVDMEGETFVSIVILVDGSIYGVNANSLLVPMNRSCGGSLLHEIKKNNLCDLTEAYKNRVRYIKNRNEMTRRVRFLELDHCFGEADDDRQKINVFEANIKMAETRIEHMQQLIAKSHSVQRAFDSFKTARKTHNERYENWSKTRNLKHKQRFKEIDGVPLDTPKSEQVDLKDSNGTVVHTTKKEVEENAHTYRRRSRLDYVRRE